jgi:glycosyltransferase involved in cell wall biosynthesis
VLAAVQFFPRGGSSHVARALALHLPSHGWDVTLVAGSRTDLGEFGDATDFYRGIDIHAVSFDQALSSPDPLRPPRGAAPMQPSYEDRADAPDRVFASLDDEAFEAQVRAWAAALSGAGAASADVLHLHHLTPIHEAASRVAPDVPVIGHLHGTELLMLEQLADGPPPGWTHAQAWVQRMRRWASRCVQVIILSPSQVPRAQRLLGIPANRLVVVPNGFDAGAFQRRDVDRASLWHEALVESPRGWRPAGAPGSLRYSAEEIHPLVTGVTVLSAGRYTEVKRLPLLIEAFARARDRARRPAGLVIVGGHPGEWEGEHPADTVTRLQVSGVFLAGWYEQAQLSTFLSAADLFALASVREQFGQVLVEAMACGLPLVAVNRLGPSEIVADGQTGWLVEPDDVDDLAAALGEAIGDPVERRRRGDLGQRVAFDRYGWAALAGRVADVLNVAVASHARARHLAPYHRAVKADAAEADAHFLTLTEQDS